MQNPRIALTVAGALAAVSAIGVGSAAADPAADVTADAHQIIAAFNAHDAAAAVSHDAPNFVGMFHGAPNYLGPAGDLAITKMQVADPAAKVVATNETVDVGASGDLAVYRATYAYTFTDAGTKAVMTEQGNWLLGYRLQPDKSWKVIWSMVSNTR
jgi:ketosteroid isomerase-like protein